MALFLTELINQGATAFEQAGLYYGHGTDNAWNEALYLAFYSLALGYDHTEEDIERLIHTREISALEKKGIWDLFQRRITQKKPAGYLTHEAFFGRLVFYVDERVLIPRSPLIEIIEKKFSPWVNSVQSILDLCTGSGCIAVACAHAFPNTPITASDISKEALEVAKINIKKYNLGNHINVIQSDVFDTIPEQQFDVIISNPPYVDEEDTQNLPDEYRHEPLLALSAGKDGLDIIRQILKKAYDYLTDSGILIVETGNSAEALMKQFPDVPFIWLEFEYGEGEVFLLYKKDLNYFIVQDNL